MKRMYDEKELQELIEKATSLDEIMKNAADITGLPTEAEMVSPYKEVIEKALKSKCVKLNGDYFFATLWNTDEAYTNWYGGVIVQGETGKALNIEMSKDGNSYVIYFYEV